MKLCKYAVSMQATINYTTTPTLRTFHVEECIAKEYVATFNTRIEYQYIIISIINVGQLLALFYVIKIFIYIR